MKKIFILLLAIGFGMSVFAQTRIIPAKELRENSVKTATFKTVKDLGAENTAITPGMKQPNIFTDEIIGNTQYDLQTNKSVMNRLHYYDDGTMGVVWTMGNDPTGFAQRGTGYNYFDGSNWGPLPTTRIENTKTGWPSYAPYLQGGEIFACHHMTDGILYGYRETKGTGTWEIDILPGPPAAVDISWPRVMTTGVNRDIIHILAGTYVTYEGQEVAITYSRSQDGGANWDIDNTIIPGLGADNYFTHSADVYSFAETKANTLAFVVGDQWTDLILMKSTDNGDTWEKTVVWEHPYPFFDFNATVTDTFYCNDGSASIALDTEGKAHIAFGLSRVLHAEVGTTYNYFYLVDGIIYWNEDMDPFGNHVHALDPYGHPQSQIVEDYNYIGWTQDVNNNGQIDFLSDVMAYRSIGISTMPNICIDDNNWIYVAWASTTEGFDNTINNFKHIWMRATHNGGATWNNFLDLDGDIIHIFDECIYPNLSPTTSDNEVFLFYQADATPGLALDDDHPYQNNNMYFVKLNKNEVIYTGENEHKAETFTVSQNYPNPSNGETSVYVKLEKPSSISLTVTDLTGKKVLQLPAKNGSKGMNKLVFNTENLTPGIYFYTVNDGVQSVSKKMMVE